MESLNAEPKLLKGANLTKIRQIVKAKGTVTRAEIAVETKISSTTVRSLLTEMMADGEIESVGYDESSGGRKAERYRFAPNRYFCVVFCIASHQVHTLLINVFGNIVEMLPPEPLGDCLEQTLISCFDRLVLHREIKAIGIGVPGIVEGGSYWRKDELGNELHKVGIGNALASRYGVPVVMENDLNAAAIGFGRTYEKRAPGKGTEDINMAYLHFEEGCISAGFIAGGRIIRGCNNYAGELGLIPSEGHRLMDECMSEPMEDTLYTERVIKIVQWICGILNPQYVALAGPNFRESCVDLIRDGLTSSLPVQMQPKVLYSSDVWQDYYEGMAYLAAGKMFDEIQLIKE